MIACLSCNNIPSFNPMNHGYWNYNCLCDKTLYVMNGCVAIAYYITMNESYVLCGISNDGTSLISTANGTSLISAARLTKILTLPTFIEPNSQQEASIAIR